jgi:nickel transport system ATP-binding protein
MGSSIIFVSHDLGTVKKMADEVLVMKDGEIVDRGDIQSIFSESQHEYTRYLVSTRMALSRNFNNLMRRV